MEYICKKLTNCLACGSNDLLEVLDLGNQPPANSYVCNPETKEDCYPLKLEYCNKCTHLQISHQVHPDILFKNYLYVSGTTSTGKEYFKDFAEFTYSYVPKKHRNVLDIACNDGTQLDYFKNLGDNTFGIDPAENLFSASSKSHKVICDYLTKDNILHWGVEFDVIIAQNVFAHLDYTADFLTYCKSALSDGGIICIQTSQSDMIKNREFDTIYHEHLSFFSLESMKQLCARVGLHIIGVHKPAIHGTSYLFVLSKSLRDNTTEFIEPSRSIQAIQEYTDSVKQLKHSLIEKVTELTKLGYAFVGYGAAAKGNTLLNYTGINLDYIVDDNPLKQGKYAPGSKIPIVSSNTLINDTRTNIIVIPLAWNFFDEIKARVVNTCGKQNIKFLRYFPEIEILENNE